MKKISVRLKGNPYDVQFGSLDRALPQALKKMGSYKKVFLIAPKPLHRLNHVKKVSSALKKNGARVSAYLIPDGEKNKNAQTLLTLYRAAAKEKLDRRSLVVAMGGGVVTDLAGFFAATYMRGLPYVSIPTTLLGMVDAAIGGKTGIDLKEGKNLVGAFWQPRLVWIDQTVLSTLPYREWKTGFGEIVKYGVIKDAAFFRWLENAFRKKPDPRKWTDSDLGRAIHRSAEIKAKVVAADEKEKPLGGGREILNFGHTMGHALEAASSYAQLTHGEAVSIGMAAAGSMGLLMGGWSPGEQMRLLTLLETIGLPIHAPRLRKREKDQFWASLILDKKNVGGKLRFIVPKKIGRVKAMSGVPLGTVRRAWRSVCP